MAEHGHGEHPEASHPAKKSSGSGGKGEAVEGLTEAMSDALMPGFFLSSLEAGQEIIEPGKKGGGSHKT
jgi:hypothetical protein